MTTMLENILEVLAQRSGVNKPVGQLLICTELYSAWFSQSFAAFLFILNLSQSETFSK